MNDLAKFLTLMMVFDSMQRALDTNAPTQGFDQTWKVGDGANERTIQLIVQPTSQQQELTGTRGAR